MAQPVQQAAPVQPAQTYEAPVQETVVERPVMAETVQRTVEPVATTTPAYETPQMTTEPVQTETIQVAPVQPAVQQPVQTEVAQPQSTEQFVDRSFDGTNTEGKPSLADSIREAAHRYETSKKEVDTWAQNSETVAAPKNETKSANRTRSIAEKLGFINFDEDELDTPSYLRKDEEVTHNNQEVSRSLDL
jgi:cell division protein FtsZ